MRSLCMHGHICECARACVRACLCTCVRSHVCVHVFASMCVCMCVEPLSAMQYNTTHVYTIVFTGCILWLNGRCICIYVSVSMGMWAS